MAIKNFTEKQIRQSIRKKVKPEVPKRRSAHDKGYIYLDGILVAKVKIPNEHDRIMKESKSERIAEALRLTHSEFNDLVDCTLTGPGYYDTLRTRVAAEQA